MIVKGAGKEYVFDYRGADSAIAINRLLKEGARVEFVTDQKSGKPATSVRAAGPSRERMERLARELNFAVQAVESKASSKSSKNGNGQQAKLKRARFARRA